MPNDEQKIKVMKEYFEAMKQRNPHEQTALDLANDYLKVGEGMPKEMFCLEHNSDTKNNCHFCLGHNARNEAIYDCKLALVKKLPTENELDNLVGKALYPSGINRFGLTSSWRTILVDEISKSLHSFLEKKMGVK